MTHISKPIAATGLGLLVFVAVFACGCTSPLVSRSVFGPTFEPTNIYQSAAALPIPTRRVAVLPLTVRTHGRAMDAGRDALQPVLLAELSKAKAFETVFVTGEDLRAWTGKPAWTAEEALPRGFLERLRQATACDAVLFCQLTVYRPYSPLAVGWSLKLVESKQGQIWWAADEVFDAGQPGVMNAVRFYDATQQQELHRSPDEWMALNSPRRFGQYSLHTLLAKLPGCNGVKVSVAAADKKSE